LGLLYTIEAGGSDGPLSMQLLRLINGSRFRDRCTISPTVQHPLENQVLSEGVILIRFGMIEEQNKGFEAVK